MKHRVVIDYDNGSDPLLVAYALKLEEARRIKKLLVAKGYSPKGIWVEEYTARDYYPVWGRAWRISIVTPLHRELLFTGLASRMELDAALTFCKGIRDLKVESYDANVANGKPLEVHYGFNSRVEVECPSGKGLRYKVPEALHFTVLGHGVPEANRWHQDNYNPWCHGKLGNVLPREKREKRGGFSPSIMDGENVELHQGQIVERIKSARLLTHPAIVRDELKKLYFLNTAHGYIYRAKQAPGWLKVSDAHALRVMKMA